MAESIDAAVDASFVIAFLMPDEKSKKVEDFFIRLRTKKIRVISSRMLSFEVINSLKTAVLRKRVKPGLAQKLLQKFLNLNIEEREIDLEGAFDISLDKNLTFYDASYLYLSLKNKVPLLTLDNKLQRLSRRR